MDPNSPLPHEAPEVSCEKALDLINNQLGLQAQLGDIHSAYRVGEPDRFKKRDRQMLIKCHPKLKEDILAVKKEKLQGHKNAKGFPVYINLQEPEAFMAKRKEISYQIKKVKEANKGIDVKLRSKFQVKKTLPFHRPKGIPPNQIPVPSSADLFVSEDEQEKLDKVKFWSSDPVTEQGNVFIGYAVKASNGIEIQRAYKRLKQLNAAATHISMAFDYQKKQGNQDDGENGAGLVLEKLLTSLSVSNKTIFVVRKASSKKIGPKRFSIDGKCYQGRH